jgi:hypothetical protein
VNLYFYFLDCLLPPTDALPACMHQTSLASWRSWGGAGGRGSFDFFCFFFGVTTYFLKIPVLAKNGDISSVCPSKRQRFNEYPRGGIERLPPHRLFVVVVLSSVCVHIFIFRNSPPQPWNAPTS